MRENVTTLLSSPVLERNSLSGMALAAVTFALLTSVDIIFKLLAHSGHPIYQILLINGGFALIPIFLWTMATGGLSRLATTRLPQHLARGATAVLSTFAAVFAYSRLPLTDFYAIMFAGPLIATTLATFWLGERIEPARWVAIAVGFFGILVVTNPLASPLFSAHNDGLDPDQAAALLGRFAAFVSVFCYALSVVVIRRMRGIETNMSFSFYGFLVSVLISGVLSLVYGAPELGTEDIAHLAVSGTLSGFASIGMMTAYHRAPIALVAPFQYTQIIWGAIAGYLIWQHVPSHHLMAGAAIVAASGFYVLYKEMGVKEGIVG